MTDGPVITEAEHTTLLHATLGVPGRVVQTTLGWPIRLVDVPENQWAVDLLARLRNEEVRS
jgi:hypothetical protein